MSKTDIDTPPAQPTPEAEAKTPWESIDPPESAQAESSAGTATQTSKPPADFKPVMAEYPQDTANRASPFASTAISAVGPGMADLASEIQALIDSHSFNEEQEINTAPAESPEEQVVTQAFLSDENSTSSTGILPVPNDTDPRESGSLAPVLGGEGWGEGPVAREDEPRDVAESSLTPTHSPEYRGEGANPAAPSAFSGPAGGAPLRDTQIPEEAKNAPQAGPLNVNLTDPPRFSATSVESPIEPATIDQTPWATMDDEADGVTTSPPATAFVEVPRESPLLERLADLELSDADLDALDASNIGDLNRGDLAVNRRSETNAGVVSDASDAETQASETIVIPSESTDDSAVTFAMTDPVAASIPQLGIVSEPAPAEESFDELRTGERAGDATVLVPEWAADIEQENAITVPQLALKPQPQTETETQWELETEIPPCPVTTGGAWTIPVMCMGIGLIACCMAIPQIDFNRRLRYDQRSLTANLQAVQKQVAVNDEFLKKVMDDPTLAERLAGRQMKTIRKGQKAIPLDHASSDESDMSPFALVAVAPPMDPPAYKPIRGTIADLCYDARSRLYLLGSAMTMVAVGLVMGFGAKQNL